MSGLALAPFILSLFQKKSDKKNVPRGKNRNLMDVSMLVAKTSFDIGCQETSAEPFTSRFPYVTHAH